MTYYQFLKESDLGPDSFSKICYEMSGEFDREFLAWRQNHTDPFDDRIEFWTGQCRDLLERVKAEGPLPLP
jgi:hypothetical protein